MSRSIADLETPAVLIDIDRVEANLKRAQAHAVARRARDRGEERLVVRARALRA